MKLKPLKRKKISKSTPKKLPVLPDLSLENFLESNILPILPSVTPPTPIEDSVVIPEPKMEIIPPLTPCFNKNQQNNENSQDANNNINGNFENEDPIDTSTGQYSVGFTGIGFKKRPLELDIDLIASGQEPLNPPPLTPIKELAIENNSQQVPSPMNLHYISPFANNSVNQIIFPTTNEIGDIDLDQ